MLGNSAEIQEKLKERKDKFLKNKYQWGLLAIGLLFLNSCWFTVDPNDRANVRRLGSPVYAQPLQSGLHLKFPLIDQVDKIQTALTTQEIKEIDVGTVDNQRVKLNINFNYQIPDSDVNRVLYKIGSVGNKGIHDQVEKTVESVAVDTIATQNMNTLNSQLEAVRATMERETFTQLANLYGIKGERLQIKSVIPSEAFMRSNEAAVNAKNAAVAAENQLKTVEFEAEQKVAAAKGEASSAIARAEGDKQAAVLEGEGNQARFKAEISAFGSATAYNDYIKAQAMLKWNGSVPEVATGNGSGTNIVLPFNALGNGSK